MMRYLLRMKDGSVTILTLVGNGTTVEGVLKKWHPEDRAKVLSWRPCEDDEIPNERTFRSAWIDAGKIAVDMPKAREAHRNAMRRARKSLLDSLDVEMSRAVRDAAKQDEIEAKRRALRDVTAIPEIEAAKTPDELKAVWPDILAAPARR